MHLPVIKVKSGKFDINKMDKFSKKKKITVPVIVVEDHNDVLHHIYRAIGSKKIPFKEGLMIHFDSHPDLVVAKHIDPKRIFEKDYVLNCVSIESWIIPAVYAGHFNSVVWMKPIWATQLDEGLHSFKIGHHKGSNEIKVTCSQSYFVSELSWCSEVELEEGRDIQLQVCTLGVPPDTTEEPQGDTSGASPAVNRDLLKEMPTFSKTITDKLEMGPYVLDIDLDFYSTRNPFYEIFSQEQFDILRKLYHYEHPKELTDEALREVTARRREQLSELKSIFTSVREGSDLSQFLLLKDVQPLLDTFPDGRPPDPDLLNDAGCTCDDCDLPHHVSSRDEVRHLVAASKRFLLQYPKPAIITIARSSRDDYCPPEDVDFIQDLVLEMLQELYGDIEISLDYETDESQEETQGTSA